MEALKEKDLNSKKQYDLKLEELRNLTLRIAQLENQLENLNSSLKSTQTENDFLLHSIQKQKLLLKRIENDMYQNQKLIHFIENEVQDAHRRILYSRQIDEIERTGVIPFTRPPTFNFIRRTIRRDGLGGYLPPLDYRGYQYFATPPLF